MDLEYMLIIQLMFSMKKFIIKWVFYFHKIM